MENCYSKRSVKAQEDSEGCEDGVVCEQEQEKNSSRRRTTRNESEKRRRDKLNVYITELAGMVPMCASSQKKLDKTTVLKMTVNYMKIHNDLTSSVLGKDSGLQASFLSSDEVGGIMDESLKGFLFVLSNTGAVTYISKNITPLFGYQLDQIIGENFLDVVHPDDRNIVLNELSDDNQTVIVHTDISDLQPSKKTPRKHTFDVRLKVGDDAVGNYCPIHVCGYTNCWQTSSMQKDKLKTIEDGSSKSNPGLHGTPHYLVAVGLLSCPNYQRMVSDNTHIEINSRHAMDGKFLYVDPSSIRVTGFWPSEILGTSLYTYIHLGDLHMLASLHEAMLEYGESKSGPYRMRCKDNQWIWMKSRSYVSYNHWNSKPEFFCSTSVVISSKEGMEYLKERQVLSRVSQQSTELMSHGSTVLKDPQEANLVLMTAWANDNSANLSDPFTMDIQELPDNNGMPAEDREDASAATSGQSHHDGIASSPQHTSTSPACSDDDDDSSGSMDLTMSYEELESFIEAQRQLHEQLNQKHTLLESAIVKQSQQLQGIQQQMLLNLQAQLTLDPGKNQQVFESQLQKTKELTAKHQKQMVAQKEFVRKLSERRKQAEKRNQKQLKYFFKKRQHMSKDFSNSTASMGSGVDSVTRSTGVSTEAETTSQEQWKYMSTIEDRQPIAQMTSPTVAKGRESCRMDSIEASVAPKAKPDMQIRRYQPSAAQLGFRQSRPDNQGQYYDCSQPVAGSQRQNTALQNTIASTSQKRGTSNIQQQQQQHHHQTEYDNAQQQYQQARQRYMREGPSPYGAQQLTTSISRTRAASSPTEPLSTINSAAEQQPNTLQNIQNLLTISSQNPEAMQMLLSGLGSKPDVAQTLLNLLKQAQSPRQHDSGALAHSMQQTTNQFSAALTANVGLDTALAHRGFSGGQRVTQQALQGGTYNSKAKSGTGSLVHMRRQGTGNQDQRDSWSSTNSVTSLDTGNLGLLPSLNSPSGVVPQGSTLQGMTSNTKSGKDKDKKDYFSNFSSQELEAMFLTPEPSTSGTAANGSVEEPKLQEEQLLHSPLLIQQHHLLQMHEEQRRQVLLRQQQEQMYMFKEKTLGGKPSARQQRAHPLQTDIPVLPPLLHDQPSTSSNVPSGEGPSSSESANWGGVNFELNDADEQVLNMLLAESSMDPLFEAWPEDDGLAGYLNLNPD